jgi:hypothetical protein
MAAWHQPHLSGIVLTGLLAIDDILWNATDDSSACCPALHVLFERFARQKCLGMP